MPRTQSKGRNLEICKTELQDAYKGKLTIITLDFLAETLKSRKA
jgi:hypothetical protein